MNNHKRYTTKKFNMFFPKSLLSLFFLQVFPSEIDFAEGGPEEALTEISPQVYLNFLFLENHLNFISLKRNTLVIRYLICQVVDDLYNPMRSPLKNRNKILCEVLGIDS